MVNSVLDILINDLTLIKEALGHDFSIKKKIDDDFYPVRLSTMRNTMKYLPGNRGVYKCRIFRQYQRNYRHWYSFRQFKDT